jgi:hypothetical protein
MAQKKRATLEREVESDGRRERRSISSPLIRAMVSLVGVLLSRAGARVRVEGDFLVIIAIRTRSSASPGKLFALKAG